MITKVARYKLRVVSRFFQLSLLALSACNPIYITQAAFQEAKILLLRQDIQKILDKSKVDEDTAFKLALTLKARAFAESLGMQTGKAYTSYSDVGRKELTWVVMGARPYAFEMADWWFPIVGRVPYRGFFNKNDAVKFAAQLEKEGYETWVRPSSAFSTLGWFNDPLLSTTLRYPAHVVVNTVLHELFHSTLWVKDSVIWNESAANFFAQHATLEFFRQELLTCQQKECPSDYINNIADQQTAAFNALNAEIKLAFVIKNIHSALKTLYNDSSKNREQILLERTQVFFANSHDFRKHFPQATVLTRLNNAEIMALRTYLSYFDEFAQQFEDSKRDLTTFLQTLRATAS